VTLMTLFWAIMPRNGDAHIADVLPSGRDYPSGEFMVVGTYCRIHLLHNYRGFYQCGAYNYRAFCQKEGGLEALGI